MALKSNSTVPAWNLTSELETELPGFYAVGDGAGITRGLSQAGASGVIAARSILAKITA